MTIPVFAQSPSPKQPITGRVLEESTRQPMEYVNVLLFRADNDSLLTGTFTGADGSFTLENAAEGDCVVEFRFMGYEPARRPLPAAKERPVELGDIALTSTTINIGDVVVEGARPTLSYRIDKKVIDVDQFSTTISGTAADVLTNVPSVSVDIEGNVSLRGSSNFTVLIDGKPSVLDAQDALQQIPASTIESIEIITNPSAKHDPEGAAGIINIAMKKQRGGGWSGMANANLGLNDKYGGDLLFEHKDGSMSTLLALDYNNRVHPGTSSEEERYTFQNNTSVIRSSGDLQMIRNTFGLRGVVEFGVGEKSLMTIGGRYGNREWQRNSVLRYEEFSERDPVLSRNLLQRRRGGYFSALNAAYIHTFNTAGHKLTADLMFRYRNSDELTISELIHDGKPGSGKKTTEEGPSRDVNTSLEYVLPFDEAHRFEAGYHGEIDLSTEATTLSEQDSLTREFVLIPRFSNDVEYKDNKYAWYALYSGDEEALGYQAGVRSEYTLRSVRLAQGEEFLIDRWDFFPTLHVSYKFSAGNQLMASYTRRINRPRGWQLEPFETWIDANNVRRGNPSLLPEFIDSYEAGIQTLLGQVSLSAEAYHRMSHNAIEDIRSVYADNVSLTTFANVGTEYSTGVEILANFDVIKKWNVNMVGNAYDYRIRGVLFGLPFSRQSFNWSARLNNMMKAGTSTQIQLNAMWNSPSVSSQGRREGFVSVDVAIRQEFMNKQLALTLQIQNVLNTARYESTSEGPGFYSYSYRQMESPVVMLTARFSINNYVPEKEDGRGSGSGDDDF